MGKRVRERQPEMWVATRDFPTAASHPFYTRLNVSFDGVDATGISNQPQKTGIRLAIPASTIAEFKVDSTLYTADSADGTGGQIVLVSRGGTNAFHGEPFEFLRNDVFDARNTFTTSKQPFRLNQFGANASGPLLRDKTFFFIGFEAYRHGLDRPRVCESLGSVSRPHSRQASRRAPGIDTQLGETLSALKRYKLIGEQDLLAAR
jgi:hypothetical protein